MNCRQKKKRRKKLYEEIISDVALEISLDPMWRKKIFDSLYEKPISVSSVDQDKLPEYIRTEIVSKNLQFYVVKTLKSEEHFDDGLIIFKFYSAEFPQISSYSGNNPNVM